MAQAAGVAPSMQNGSQSSDASGGSSNSGGNQMGGNGGENDPDGDGDQGSDASNWQQVMVCNVKLYFCRKY